MYSISNCQVQCSVVPIRVLTVLNRCLIALNRGPNQRTFPCNATQHAYTELHPASADLIDLPKSDMLSEQKVEDFEMQA